MQVSDVLQKLPASLEWMVLFSLPALRDLAVDTVVRAMFFLPADTALAPYSHIVLSDQGHFLAPRDGAGLLTAGDLLPASNSLLPTPRSLYDRFAEQLRLFPVDEADCLGLGEQPPYPPVLLHLKVKSGHGQAKALFHQEPARTHYELLPAVGLKFLGGSQRGPYYVAEFTNLLPVHIHAGVLAHFSRTSHCNQFLLQHGNIDSKLAIGLARAAKDRVTWARDRSLETMARLGQRACRQPLAMTCQPPPPAQPYPFGDLVPLAFLFKALAGATRFESTPHPSITEACQVVRQFLLAKRQGHLWAFHTGRLVTSTDSALILQGLIDHEAVEALETFADGQGGYYPQLWSEAGQPGRMLITPANQHWCRPDYATTCLVRGLRQKAGLPPKTPLDYLAAGFGARSGLYFANPYLVDWALASAIADDETAAELRHRLLAEVLGSMNENHTFGRYDVALSTALAILSLAALGYRGRTMRLAQLSLLDFMEAEGLWPEAIPFYSTLYLDHTGIPAIALFNLLLNDYHRYFIQVNGQYHAISFYLDSHRMITTSLAALALSERCRSASRDLVVIGQASLACHPRYRCGSHSEYVAKFALPPYLGETAGIQGGLVRVVHGES